MTIDTALITASISAIIAILGYGFTYVTWRQDFKRRMTELHDQVTVELIQQRIPPYKEFFKKLESMSNMHAEEIKKDSSYVLRFGDELQSAIYGDVGLLAAYDTRQIMVYVRNGCYAYAAGSLDYPDLVKRIWTLHLALRGDLGITQADWPDEIQMQREQALAYNGRRLQQVVSDTDYDIDYDRVIQYRQKVKPNKHDDTENREGN